jgi:hypothetical protein
MLRSELKPGFMGLILIRIDGGFKSGSTAALRPQRPGFRLDMPIRSDHLTTVQKSKSP